MNHKRIVTLHSSGSYTVPSGVTEIFFEAFGPGAAGSQNAGAGGGGAYNSLNLTGLTAGIVYNYVQGVPGTSDGQNAGFSYWQRQQDGPFPYPIFADTNTAKGGGSNGGEGGRPITGNLFDGGDGSQGSGTRYGGTGAGDEGDGLNGDTTGNIQGGEFFGGSSARSSALLSNRGYGSGGYSSASDFGPGRPGAGRVNHIENIADYAVVRNRYWGRTQGTSHTINLPTGTEVGDLLIIAFSAASNSDVTIASGGWTRIGYNTQSSPGMAGAVFYKFAEGSDTATVTTGDSVNATHLTFSIRSGGIPFIASSNGTSTNVNPPSLDAGSVKKYYWMTLAMRRQATNDASLISAPPTNYTDFLYLSSLSDLGGDIATASRHLEDDVEDPGAYTSQSEHWVAFTLAVPFKYIIEETHTIDTFVVDRLTNNYSIDTLVKSNETKAHTIDTLISSTNGVEHSIDTLIKQAKTISHSIDTLVTVIQSEEYTIDALIKESKVITNSIDTLISGGDSVSHVVDTLIKAKQSIFHSLDTLIKESENISHSIDTYIVNLNTVSNTVDTLIKEKKTLTYNIDTLIKESKTANHTLDTLIKQSSIVANSIDTMIKAGNGVTHSIDALLKETHTLQHTINTYVVNRETLTHTIDTFVKSSFKENYTLDTLIKDKVQSSYSIDTLIFVKPDKSGFFNFI